MVESDVTLWELAVAGDPAAFGDLYRRHVDRVFTHCLRRTAVSADAEDLTSEVFARSLAATRPRPAHRPRQPHPLAPRNREQPAAPPPPRRFRRDRLTERLAIHLSDTVDHADDVIGSIDDARDLRQLTRVLSTLRPRDREVIHLCVIEGLTPAAVALTFGEPAGTIRSRLSRALDRARDAMSALADTPTSERTRDV